MALLAWVVLAFTLIVIGTEVHSQGAEFWNSQAQETLKKAIKNAENLNRKVAKNVVVFVGDGMGPSTVTAARILKGQLAGLDGEGAAMAWEDFPSVGHSKTYNTNRQVGDSAGSGTALFSGVKTKSALIGLDDSTEQDECPDPVDLDKATVDSIMVHAKRAGKSTGFVTTTTVTHATPAAMYARTPQRDWESDGDIPSDQAAKGCTDIALQLMTRANDTNVILGGGRRAFLPETVLDPEYGGHLKGRRKDGRNLIDEWIESKDAASSKYVWKLDDFEKVDPDQTNYLLGLFEWGHMQFSGYNDIAGEPSIAQMTEKAIQILQKNDNGFLLMVEGGRIDHGHHIGSLSTALYDTVALDEAVAKAIELTDEEDTLVIVTADHSHTLTISGNPRRGNSILGLDDSGYDIDGLPYTTLQYADGPGGTKEKESYEQTGKRRNLTGVNTAAPYPYFVASSFFPELYASHAGEDVAIYASGPMSHLIHGVHEQNYVSHVVRYAACLDYREHCDDERTVLPLSHYAPTPEC